MKHLKFLQIAVFMIALFGLSTQGWAQTTIVLPQACNCPSATDSDGDGVPDTLDACPGTPLGTPVDANGCPIGNSPSTNGTGVVSSYGAPACTANTINGTMTAGTLVSGVTMSLYANVTTLGTYNLSSTQNGVTFTGTGTFTTLGCQLITLTATGTPTAAGPFTWCTNTTPQGCSPATVATGTPIALNCDGASFSPNTISDGTFYSGTLTVPYTNGDGTAYPATTIGSTNVTGLTATLAAGTLANGAGNLVYNVSGTPANPGAAQFLISLNGQSCTKSASVSAVGLQSCPVGTVVSFSPCSSLSGATLNDNPATTLSVEYDWTLGSTQMRGGSNTRALLEIGGQCWFARDAIAPCSTGTCTTLTQDGARLYNWNAAMGGSTTEGAQGVCPAGFHIPTNCEFAYLTLAAGATTAEINTTFSSQGNNVVTSVNGRFHAAQNNLTGWSATFQGWESNAGSGSVSSNGTYDDYWTSTTDPSDSTEARAWTAQSPGSWSAWPWVKTAGYQVRCIRN